MNCKIHSDIKAIHRCTGCQESFCENCLVYVNGKYYCGNCKIMAVNKLPIVKQKLIKTTSAEANDVLKLAIFSTFVFPLEICAIVKALQIKSKLEEYSKFEGEEKVNFALYIGILVIVLGMNGIYLTLLTFLRL